MNNMIYYLKIVQAYDSILEPECERVIYGNSAQYHLLKSLAKAYTLSEKCMAFVGFVGNNPEKAYFDGREILVVTENGTTRYYTIKKGELRVVEAHTFAYCEEEAKRY